MKKIAALVAVAALSLAACSEEDDTTVEDAADDAAETADDAAETADDAADDAAETADDAAEAADDAADPSTILPGVRSVRDSLERNLDTLGLSKVGKVGEAFNPDFHEALTAMPTENPAQAGTIADVFEIGFVKGERLVRPARVVVYQG